MKYALFCYIFLPVLLLTVACSDEEEYESAESISKAIQNLPKEWFLITEKEGKRVLIEPYEGLNPTFKFEYDFSNERVQIRYQANLNQRTWVVQKIVKKGRRLNFFLLENGSNRNTLLSYSPTDHPAIGKWKESSATFLPYKVSLFAWDKSTFEEITQNTYKNTASSGQGKWLRMKGKLEDKDYALWAFMCVESDENNLQFERGVYYYDTFWRDIYLENARNYLSKKSEDKEKFEWIIEEREAIDAENISGYFKGMVDYEYNFEGIWESAKTNQSLKFNFEEKILPYEIENQLKHFRTADGSSLCIYYPQLSGLDDESILTDFNEKYIKYHVDAWQKEFLVQGSALSRVPDNCDIEISYNIIFANENLVSGLFFIRQGSKRTEYIAFNYNLKENKVFRLYDMFETGDSFEKRIQIRAKRHVEVESERHNTRFEPYDSLTVLEHYNFLPDNLRLTLYSQSQKKFFPIYIPYKDLRAYIKDRPRKTYLRFDDN